MKQKDINSMVFNAISSAVLVIQEGITESLGLEDAISGDFAGLYFADDKYGEITDVLADYARAQIYDIIKDDRELYKKVLYDSITDSAGIQYLDKKIKIMNETRSGALTIETPDNMIYCSPLFELMVDELDDPSKHIIMLETTDDDGMGYLLEVPITFTFDNLLIDTANYLRILESSIDALLDMEPEPEGQRM